THEDLTAENCSQSDIQQASELFPDKKFPDNYSDLNEKQKKFLYQNGGALTLLLLGKISHIYKTYFDSDQKYRMHQEAQEYASTLFKPPEDLALTLAKQAAQQTQKSEVLIIFGAHHDFTSDDPSIKFNQPIDTITPAPNDRAAKKLMQCEKHWLNLRKTDPENIFGRVTNAAWVLDLKGYKIALIDSLYVLDHFKNLQTPLDFIDQGMYAKAKDIASKSEATLKEIAEVFYNRSQWADALPYYEFLNQHCASDSYREKIIIASEKREGITIPRPVKTVLSAYLGYTRWKQSRPTKTTTATETETLTNITYRPQT